VDDRVQPAYDCVHMVNVGAAPGVVPTITDKYRTGSGSDRIKGSTSNCRETRS